MTGLNTMYGSNGSEAAVTCAAAKSRNQPVAELRGDFGSAAGAVA